MDTSPDSLANNIYSPGSDKLTEAHLYISQLITARALVLSTACQAGSRVIRAFSDVEKPFSGLANKPSNQKIKKRLFNVREGSD